MWTCPNCGRIFQKANQPHSCIRVPLETHFKNKDKAQVLFNHLVEKINAKIGPCQVISIPCCIHIYGNYDFLAALPKKDRLEIRFAFNRTIEKQRIKQYVAMSARVFKICLDLAEVEEIDEECIGWLSEAYHLKDK